MTPGQAPLDCLLLERLHLPTVRDSQCITVHLAIIQSDCDAEASIIGKHGCPRRTMVPGMAAGSIQARQGRYKGKADAHQRERLARGGGAAVACCRQLKRGQLKRGQLKGGKTEKKGGGASKRRGGKQVEQVSAAVGIELVTGRRASETVKEGKGGTVVSAGVGGYHRSIETAAGWLVVGMVAGHALTGVLGLLYRGAGWGAAAGGLARGVSRQMSGARHYGGRAWALWPHRYPGGAWRECREWKGGLVM